LPAPALPLPHLLPLLPWSHLQLPHHCLPLSPHLLLPPLPSYEPTAAALNRAKRAIEAELLLISRKKEWLALALCNVGDTSPPTTVKDGIMQLARHRAMAFPAA
jgi:hypothetical protein